ncbi:MAG: hypothetical protein KC646_00650 [Candidatus Cloacimonetes bacterium]|nr:hypothetical protein [Candidatus Cloacimonadota bacterium]
MRLKTTLQALFLILFTLLSGCGLQTESEAYNTSIQKSVSGVVARGKALNNKVISLLDDNLNVITTSQTDSLGKYTFTLPSNSSNFYIKSEDLMSFIPKDSNTNDAVVHVNPITTFSANEVLKLPVIQRNKNSFESAGQALVTKVLGPTATFESFSSDEAFVAANEQNTSQPSIADMMLDGIQEKANSKNLTQFELIEHQTTSTNTCDQKGLLNDDIFETSLLANIADNKLNSNQISQSKLKNSLASFSVTEDNVIIKVFTTLSDQFSEENSTISKAVILDSFKKSIFKVIDDEIKVQNVCSLSELNPNSLENLVKNLYLLINESIDLVKNRVNNTNISPQAKEVVFANALIQSSNIASQLNISTPLSNDVLTVGKSLSDDIMNQTQVILTQEITLNPDSISSALNTKASQDLASLTQSKRQELVDNPLLVDSIKPTVPETFELLITNNATDNDTPILVRPINIPQGVNLTLTLVNQRSVSGSILVSRSLIEGDIQTYNLYWGKSPTSKIDNSALISKIDKLDQNLIVQLNNIVIPREANYILAFSAQDTLESLDSVFTKITKPTLGIKRLLLSTATISKNINYNVITLKRPNSTIHTSITSNLR